MQRSFQHVRTVPKGTDWKSGEYIISNIISGVDAAKRAKRPFFITAHFDDVHHPYRAFVGRSVPRFSHRNRDLSYYDRCIANMDNMLRPLISHLRHTGVWDDTILIITSDHGEEFGEHGETIHSRSCYIESVHVPLIVRVPGFAPARVEQRVSLVDIVPTLVEALDLPRDGFDLDGQSLFVPAVAPERVTADRPIFCSIFQLLRGRKNFFTRSVRTQSHTLIHEALSDTVELFDNDADPREAKNIASAEAGIVESLRETLKASLSGNLWEARRFK
jgi:arylsulfatase A-like enzyme